MRLKVIKKTNKKSLRDKVQQGTVRVRTVAPLDLVPAAAQCCTSAADSIQTATERTVNVLNSAGLYKHFIICNKSKNDSKRIVQRFAQFIVWSYTEHNNTTIIANMENVTWWFHALMHEHYQLLLSFCEHLVHKKQLKPSTVRTYSSDLEKCFEWGTLFAPPPMKAPMNSHDGIRAVAGLVRTNQARSQRAARSHNTWHELVQNRRIPAGGLAALQGAVVEELPWARTVRAQDIDDVAYRRFVQLVVSAVYVFSANGRQSGVSDVRMGQVEGLLGDGFTTTTKFKTNSKFGYQPITLGVVAQELVYLYVQTVRPQVCRAAEIHPDDHMWITYRGEADLHVGKLVTMFFIRKLGLSVTTTSIRGLVETTMDQKYKAGQISETERMAVQNINGHSSAVTRDYYLYEDRVDDVRHAQAAFAAVTIDIGTANDMWAALAEDDVIAGPAVPHLPTPEAGALVHMAPQPPAPLTPAPLPPSPLTPAPLPPSPQSLSTQPPAPLPPSPLPLSTLPPASLPPSPPRWPVSSLPQPLPMSSLHWSQAGTLDWGSAHPDYGTSNATARWTWAEKEYLGNWCGRFEREFPEANNVVAQALKAIRQDSRAIAIFHANHTLNSARLRHGLRQYQAEQKAQNDQLRLRQFTVDVLNQSNH